MSGPQRQNAGLPVSNRALMAVLCGIAGIGQAGSFLYLPALPLVAADFNTTEGGAQATLTAFLLGSCLGFALYGRIADRLGHRRVFVLACGLFVAASLAAALSEGLGVLIVARLLQGAGSVAGVITARATIRTVFPADRAIQAMALLTAVISVSPAISPLIGAAILRLGDWRLTFAVAAALGTVALLAGLWALPHTADDSTAAAGEATAVPRFLANPQYRAAIVMGVSTHACFMVMMAGSPFVFVEILGLSPGAYSVLISAVILVFTVITLASGRLVPVLGLRRQIGAGLAMTLSGGAALVLAALVAPTPLWLGLALAVTIGGMGLVVPGGHVLQLAPFPANAGAAAGLSMLITTGAGAVAITAYGLTFAGSIAGFGLAMALTTVIGAVGWHLLPGPADLRH